MNNSTTLDPADRFAHIIDGLCWAVAARSRGGAVSGPLIFLLWHRLRRLAGRFAQLAATLRLGALPPRSAGVGPAGTQRPRAERRVRAGRTPRLLPNGQPDRLPDGLYRGFGWLVRLAPEAAVCTGRLENLLADPDMVAMLGASPPMARLLRPLCRMLAVAPGPLPPRRRRSPLRPAVIPAKAGIRSDGAECVPGCLDPGFRRDDGGGLFHSRRGDGKGLFHSRRDDGGGLFHSRRDDGLGLFHSRRDDAEGPPRPSG